MFKVGSMISASTYQNEAARTINDTPDAGIDLVLVNMALGLAGEAGEIVELIKKGTFHGHTLDKAKLSNELGDLAWYLAGICTVLDLSYGEVLSANIEKLRQRYPQGFSTADSIERRDVDA